LNPSTRKAGAGTFCAATGALNVTVFTFNAGAMAGGAVVGAFSAGIKGTVICIAPISAIFSHAWK